MKRFFLLLTVIIFSASCHAQHSLKEIEWLLGEWNRTNTKPGKSGVEQWWKISDTAFAGKGISLKGVDTVFVEKLKIIVKDNQLYYVADIPENNASVLFRFTSITTHGFVCENPHHDFPKKIAYQREGNFLKATISGNGKEIDYHFETVSP